MTYEEYMRIREEARARGEVVGCIEATITGKPPGPLVRAAERLFPGAFPSAEPEQEAGLRLHGTAVTRRSTMTRPGGPRAPPADDRTRGYQTSDHPVRQEKRKETRS